MQTRLKQHKWIFVWSALVAFYLVAIFYRGESNGVRVRIGPFRWIFFERVLLCIGIISLVFIIWLFLHKIAVRIVFSIVLALIVFVCSAFIPLRLLSQHPIHDTYIAEDGTQIVVYALFPDYDAYVEYERHGVLELSRTADLTVFQGLQSLFINPVTLWFVGIGAALIIGRKIFTVDTKRE